MIYDYNMELYKASLHIHYLTFLVVRTLEIYFQ
jgi:hypothetical protein